MVEGWNGETYVVVDANALSCCEKLAGVDPEGLVEKDP